MSPVESMAAGKPVIGSGEGGLLETIIHGETGWLSSSNPHHDELIQGIIKINPKQAALMRESCEKKAMSFCTEVFIEKMREVIG